LIPEGYKVMKISYNIPFLGIFSSQKCRLEKFDFMTSIGELLIYPI